MANSVTQDRRSKASGAVSVQILGISCLHRLEINGEVTNVATSVRPRNMLEWDTCTLKAFEHDLEKLALLWVHVRCFEVVDSKELVLKGADILVEEVPALSAHAAGTI